MDASIGENSPTRRRRTACGGGNRNGRLEMSLGGGWNVSLIYDVSRGKSGNESWSSVFAANREGGREGARVTSKASWVDRNAKIKINESARQKGDEKNI